MIINGKKIAEDILTGLKKRLELLPTSPLLCDVVVGNDPVSLSYVRIKQKTAERIGIGFRLAQLPETISTQDVIEEVKKIQNDPHLRGLIIQLPLPGHIDSLAVLRAIEPLVDVDVISPVSTTLFYNNQNTLVPPTAGAILEILNSLDLDPAALHKILVIGQGELVGKPITHLLRQQGYTVAIADLLTEDLKQLTPQFDIIISGTGQARLVTGDMVKPGAIVIDAGTSESGSGIVGDIDFISVKDVASAVSPVPGGVGPVTVAKLLENVVKAAEYIIDIVHHIE